MAQLVEQLIRNQQVAGSNPAISSKKKSLPFSVDSFFFVVGFESAKLPADSLKACDKSKKQAPWGACSFTELKWH